MGTPGILAGNNDVPFETETSFVRSLHTKLTNFTPCFLILPFTASRK